MRHYDLVVVGGGTAGLVAALGAAGVGAKVLLAERERTGGDCLWTGCVPSKSLLAAADLAHRMRHADELGLPPVEPRVDLARVMERIRAAQRAIAPHDSPERLRRAGVDVRIANARFVRPGVVDVGGDHVRYRTALIATGSRPVMPPIDGLEENDVLTTDSVWDLTELPNRLVVIGGGPVGCELGQAFARLGSAVTLVEMLPRLLHGEEPEASDLVQRRLEADGVDVQVGTIAAAVRRGQAGPELLLDGDGDARTVPFDRLLVAAGRAPETAAVGLEQVNVETDDDGHVVVDERLATTGRGIFAAGDVCASPPFTHVAAYEGGLVVANALFHLRRKPEYERVPWVTFTDPEVARIGITEEQARERHGDDVLTERYAYDTLDRAVTAARTHGFAKVIANPRGRLVGATVAGTAAGESVAEVAAWMAKGGTLGDLSQTVHAYPTFSLGLKHAADEHMRAKWFSPRVRGLTRPLLALLRLIER